VDTTGARVPVAAETTGPRVPELVVAGPAPVLAVVAGAGAVVAGAVAVVAGAEVPGPELVVAGAAPVLAEVAAVVAGAGAEVAGVEVPGPELVVAGAAPVLAEVTAEVAGAVGVGVVAACADRENSSKAVRIPAATIAACTARRAMRRTISCGMSSSRSTGIDRTEARNAHHPLPETPRAHYLGLF